MNLEHGVKSMQYQVSYLSPNGHAQKAAEAIADILPADTKVVDLQEGCEVFAQTHIIGYELNEASLHAVPYAIMELLNELDGCQIVLFVTSPFQVDSNAKNVMENKLAPFIPEDSEYGGLFLCAGQATDSFLSAVRKEAELHPVDAQVKARLARCEESIGHPDEDDLMRVCSFIADALNLEF